MVTTWPAQMPGLSEAAGQLAQRITAASGGRIRVELHHAGELIPPFEVFDAVSSGDVELGHSAAYFWQDKAAAAPFFCTVPFGLNAQEMGTWLHAGGGLALWRELYAPFNLVPFPAGSTGMQMAGWFKHEIRTPDDLNGLRMRIPGLGGEVMARMGVIPVNLPGSELVEALDSNAIDAAEWMGPYNDAEFQLHRSAAYCYYPGWQEPGTTLECIVHKPVFEALPDDLKAVVENCCRAAHDATVADYLQRNQQAFDAMVTQHGIQFRLLPDEVLQALRRATDDLLAELGEQDPFVAQVLVSLQSFRQRAAAWARVSEAAYYAVRDH